MTHPAVYAAAARHKIPCRRLGRKLVFDVMELDTFMHSLSGVAVDEAVGRWLNNGTISGFPKESLT